MPTPGTEVILKDTTSPRSTPADTGAFFAVGLTDRGLSSKALRVQSLAEFETLFGARQSYSVLYDAIDAFFREGGRKAYIGRVVGPASTTGTLTLTDRAGSPLNTLKVDAFGAGAWSANVTVQTADGVQAGTFVLTIRESGVLKEVSPDLVNPNAAVAWSQDSKYVRITDLVSATAAPANNPKVQAATALSAGADDRVSAAEADWLLALNLFDKALGPGQVAMPGRSTSTAHTNLAAHCTLNTRVALPDPADTKVVATLQGFPSTLRASSVDEKWCAFFAPWVRIPGIGVATPRSVPPSAVVAGIIARMDSFGNPNQPAAGANGISRYALSLTQAAWTEAERGSLNTAGINALREMYDGVRVYGFRSSADPVTEAKWIQFNGSRTVMAYVARANEIAENHVFKQLDGQGIEISKYGGELTGLAVEFYDKQALYGTTPDEAFSVDVGSAVNTPTTIANGELHAVVGLKTSPFAERVYVEIVKVGVADDVV